MPCSRAPAREERHGIAIEHPRYPLLPRAGMTMAPASLYLSTRRLMRRILRQGYEFDLIDAHFFYPDGVAAILLGRWLGKPVVITARGNDLSLVPRYRLPRRMIQWAAARASGLVTVCAALKTALVELGVPAERVTVLRNGVDLATFRPLAKTAMREKLGFARPTLLSIGHLIERKANDIAIRALPLLPEFDLVLCGEGPERAALQALAAAEGVAERVRFLGRVPHERLAECYSAADILVLASSREGWANVLLEAMACGTPVVASNVWGTPEAVEQPAAGLLMPERTPASLAQTVRRLQAALPSREATRRYAEQYDWSATTQGQIELFRRVTAKAN